MIKVDKQIPIKVMQTKKFKTITLSIFFKSPMDKSRAASRHLLSKMMIKRTSRFNREMALLDFLSEYYGAHLTSTTFKRGSDHVVRISLEFVNDKFILEELDILNRMIELFKDILDSPSAYNEDTQSFFEKELRLYKNRLNNYLDHKEQKSFIQMMDMMFENHPMRIPSYGTLENIESLTLESVKTEYDRLINNDEAAIVIVGDVDAEVEEKLSNLLARDKKVELTNRSYTFEDAVEVKNGTATMDIEQAKLNIGFTIKTENKIDRINLSAVNQMFGGSVNAFLFRNVREHMSLAYQIFSSLDARNGFLHVSAGVDIKNVDTAASAILDELERIRSGNFNDDFLEEIKLMMRVNRKETEDGPKGLTGILYNQLIAGKVTDYEELLTHVTRERVMDVARRLSLNTVHVLTGGKSNEN